MATKSSSYDPTQSSDKNNYSSSNDYSNDYSSKDYSNRDTTRNANDKIRDISSSSKNYGQSSSSQNYGSQDQDYGSSYSSGSSYGKTFGDMTNRVEDFTENLQEKGRYMTEQLKNKVLENPWPYIGGAALAALAIGFLAGRKTTSTSM